MKYIMDGQYEIKKLIFNDKLCQIFYKNTQIQYINSNGNVLIGAFVTAQARLKLFEYLNLLKARMLYYDTDSIIFISRNDFKEPQIGNFFGDLTNELSQDEYIYEFVSTGPKNYSYKTNKNKTKCVIKGFTLNYDTSKLINFESLKNILLSNLDNKITVNKFRIKNTLNDWKLENLNFDKTFKSVYDKRILLENFETVPFGYKY